MIGQASMDALSAEGQEGGVCTRSLSRVASLLWTRSKPVTACNLHYFAHLAGPFSRSPCPHVASPFL